MLTGAAGASRTATSRVNGFPWERRAFARISGYVEQTGVNAAARHGVGGADVQRGAAPAGQRGARPRARRLRGEGSCCLSEKPIPAFTPALKCVSDCLQFGRVLA